MPSNQADFLYLNIMENYSLVTGASSGIGLYNEMFGPEKMQFIMKLSNVVEQQRYHFNDTDHQTKTARKK